MRVLVCGSRMWMNYDVLDDVLSWLDGREGNIDDIIHGGANGADKMAGEWADELTISTTVVLPDWEKYGRGAGFKRNIEMLDMEPDVVVAFWDGESRGTMHTVTEARKRGILTMVITC